MIGGWLQFGSDKGWQGKARAFILYTLVLGFAGLGIYLYIINLADMGRVKAFVIGISISMTYSLFGFIFWAVKRTTENNGDKK